MTDQNVRFMIGQAEIAARPLEAGLYIVSTPIGNLGDVTLRALETLAAADVLACEDTRVTRKLLNRYGIFRRTTAYHEHNAAEAGPRLLAEVEAGRSVALVSDAGTPLVSDPGFRLVAAVRERGLRIVPVPGASAVLTGLVASGLPSDAFMFAGFLPVKEGPRRRRIEELRSTPATLIFFESPRRLAKSLASLAAALGEDRRAVVARELTKTFEETRSGALADLAQHYITEGAPRGEVVVLIAPPAEAAAAAAGDLDEVLLSLAAGMPAARAAAEAARLTGRPKGDLYRRLLDLKRSNQDG